jgi:outer membrane murein-binding lipoprotein Lpp
MKHFFNPLICFCLVITLLLSLWLSPSKAVTLTDSRINQLEFGLRSLQAQVNQLQSQIPQSGGNSGNRPSNSPSPAPALGEPTPAEQFDNLATLVIEINQRVAALEARLSETSP